MERDSRGRFLPGSSGNPRGRPVSPFSRMRHVLKDSEVDKVIRRCWELALGGDPTALRLVMERLDPAPRERPVYLPELAQAQGPEERLQVLLTAVANGVLTPNEALKLAQLVTGALTHELLNVAEFQSIVISVINELEPEVAAKLVRGLTEARNGRRKDLALAPPAAP